MSPKFTICGLLAVTTIMAMVVQPCGAYPMGNPPLSYNLHSQFTAMDINQLSGKSRQNIARTIAEVEKVLASDPNLPRLTRGEIAELFEQVAKEELQKSIQVGDYKRAKQMRALMVVLPFSTSNKDDMDSLQDLYTKTPVTRVIEKEILPPVTTRSIETTRAEIPTTTRRSSSTVQFNIPDDYFQTTSFKPLPAFHMQTTTERQPLTIPSDLQIILNQMQMEAGPRKPTQSPGPVNSDVKEVLQSLGLWEDNERPTTFSKQTISQNFAPIELDFETGTRKTIETAKVEEIFLPKSPAPQIQPADFVSFKPIPKLEKSEVKYENYEYFKNLGVFDSPKASRAYNSDPPALNKAIVSKKAQGFSRRKSDVSYETDILKKISKQEREQLLDVLQKLERQVIANKLGPQPVDHTEAALETKKEYKRQEESSSSEAPIKFSLNLLTDLANDTQQVTKSNITLASEENGVQTILAESEGRIMNKGTTTTTEEPPMVVLPETTESSSDAPLPSDDADSVTFPPLNMDEVKLENLDDVGLDPVAEEPAPPVKKNGFYFLADWNSFLEVGEGKDRVEVRFTPRVGDSRLFIPVTVP